MRRPLLIPVLGVILASSLTACSVGSDPEADNGGTDQGGTLTIAIGSDATSLDPAAQSSAGVMQRVRQVTESLTTLDEEGGIQPLLATEWSSSDDGLEWTFTLREGVTFSDGTDFNAEAVKFSMDRLLGGEVEGGRPDAMAVIAETTVVDDYTVVFTLSDPYPALPTALFQPMAAIISPDSVTESGNTFEQIVHPVGTGPYVFSEHVAGDALTLTRNEDYWGETPSFDTQVWQVVPEPASRMALLRSGDADIIADPPGTEIAGLSDDDDYIVRMMDLPQTMLFFFNQETVPEFSQLEVRQALSYAVNREALVDNLVYGAAEVLDSPLPEFDFGACGPEGYEYDPELAEDMLADAGVENLSVRMAAPSGRYLNDNQVGQAVAGDLRAVGVEVDFAPAADFPTYMEQLFAEPADATIDMGMIALGSIFLDGGHALRSYRTDNQPPDGYNGGFYSSPEVDAMSDQINITIDDDERAELICELSTTVTEDAAAMWLYVPQSPIVMTSDLEGLTTLPSSFLDPSTVSRS